MNIETMILLNIAITITTMIVCGGIYKIYFTPDSIVPHDEFWVGETLFPFPHETVLSPGDFCVGARYNNIVKRHLNLIQAKDTIVMPDGNKIEYMLHYQVRNHLKAAESYYNAGNNTDIINSYLTDIHNNTEVGKGTALPEKETFLEQVNERLRTLFDECGAEVCMKDYKVLPTV